LSNVEISIKLEMLLGNFRVTHARDLPFEC
jgi:hypothetical protein